MPELTVPFASHDELAARLGVTLSTADQDRADALLLAASRMIQDEARSYIAQVTETVTLRGTTDERVKLPQGPVVSVSSVVVNGQTLAAGSDYYLDGNELVRMPNFIVLNVMDIPFPLGRGFGWPTLTLSVTYTHGYDSDTMPGIVKAICLEVVTRVWVNPGSVSMENVSGVAVGYPEQRGLLLTDAERKALRRFFGRRAHSITLGDY